MEISTSTTIESTAIRGLAKINGVIMEWVNGALFLVDSLNMNFIEVNKKAVALLGYTQPELLAMKVDQVINLCFDCFRERSCSDGNPLIKEAKLLTPGIIDPAYPALVQPAIPQPSYPA